MPERAEWQVPAELGGERLDLILARLAGVSRTVARRLCDEGVVEVGGTRRAASDRVDAGMTVSATLPQAEQDVTAADVAFDVVYEDDDLLVVDKPPGLVVHPGAGHRHDTLVNGLLHRYPDLAVLAGRHRWGIVHRLDRDTSGLLIVAKTAEAHEALQGALKRREVSRTYLALVDGMLPAATGTIEAPVARDPAQPTRMAVRHSGKAARTHYRVHATWANADLTLAEVELETGRTHQIRVHFASIGHPVAGDRVYGFRRHLAFPPPRVWLHAARLAFRHPTSGAAVALGIPLAMDLRSHLSELGPPAAGTVPEWALPASQAHDA